ncbi:hypothetical protein BsWGS_25468 [Bradybaena similaris]
MTSLQFYPESPLPEVPPPIWGTGRQDVSGLWVPRAPTWHTIGEPRDQKYRTTFLKLSNVRDNDELVPRPQAVEISKKCINKPFPAEHPYASHIEKYATIPKFDSPQDPKRGASARQQRPISDEMPANPHEVMVVKKTKGHPYREEIIKIPSEGQRQPLYWPGENYFDQPSKIHGNRQQYYPAPPKTCAPNLQERPEELSLSERTQNVLRNIERSQWIPSYQLDYTGLGPANPLVLDNLDCKKEVFLNTGVWDDKLYPRSINTFDPSESLEGHMRKLFAPKPAQQILLENQMFGSSNDNRKINATELEEQRLLNGKEYVNLPESCNDPLKNMKYQERDPYQEASHDVEARASSRQTHQGQGECWKDKGYLEEMRVQRYKAVQGIEARNRWKLLESSTPSHDIVQLREKYKILNKKEMPVTFYRHEGEYNEERAGLYKTSYDPQQLAYSMNAKQLSGGVLFNTSLSHVDASLYPTVVWDENEAALNGSRTVVFKNSSLSGDRPSSSDTLNPYRTTVAFQRHILQPRVDTSRPLVQEGKFIQREDTYGDSYNTKKFLQENKLDRNIRIEPRDLMSHENQNLERTRETAFPVEAPGVAGMLKSVHHSDDVSVRNMHENMPVKIEESHVQELSVAERRELARAFGHEKATSLSYMQTHPDRPNSAGFIIGDTRNLAENLMHPTAVPTVVARNTERVTKPQFVSFTQDPQLKPPPISETADQFRKLTTRFMPVGIKHEAGQASCGACESPSLDLGEKFDPRFQWQPGTGQLRPQSCLKEMQDGFMKSEVHKRFHRQFPESNPDIRANFTTGQDFDLTGQCPPPPFSAELPRHPDIPMSC